MSASRSANSSSISSSTRSSSATRSSETAGAVGIVVVVVVVVVVAGAVVVVVGDVVVDVDVVTVPVAVRVGGGFAGVAVIAPGRGSGPAIVAVVLEERRVVLVTEPPDPVLPGWITPMLLDGDVAEPGIPSPKRPAAELPHADTVIVVESTTAASVACRNRRPRAG
jgi:hypothetical protein